MFAARAQLMAGMIPPPSISGISPGSFYSGNGGTVTITGTNFIPGATVTVGGNAASSISVNSSTSITCYFPGLGLGTYTVTVTTSSGSATSTFSYTQPPIYPYISSVSPTTIAYTGGTLYAYGSGFNATGSLLFYINNSWITGVIQSDSQAYCGTPALSPSTSYSVAVYNYSGGWSNTIANAFTTTSAAPVVPPPTVTGVSPTTVARGTSPVLTIYGTNFTASGGMVAFSGGGLNNWGLTYTFINSSTIQVQIPAPTSTGAILIYPRSSNGDGQWTNVGLTAT